MIRRRENPEQLGFELPEPEEPENSHKIDLELVEANRIVAHRKIDKHEVQAVGPDWHEITVNMDGIFVSLAYNEQSGNYEPKYSDSINPALLEKVNAWAKERKAKLSEKKQKA